MEQLNESKEQPESKAEKGEINHHTSEDEHANELKEVVVDDKKESEGITTKALGDNVTKEVENNKFEIKSEVDGKNLNSGDNMTTERNILECSATVVAELQTLEEKANPAEALSEECKTKLTHNTGEQVDATTDKHRDKVTEPNKKEINVEIRTDNKECSTDVLGEPEDAPTSNPENNVAESTELNQKKIDTGIKTDDYTTDCDKGDSTREDRDNMKSVETPNQNVDNTRDQKTDTVNASSQNMDTTKDERNSETDEKANEGEIEKEVPNTEQKQETESKILPGQITDNEDSIWSKKSLVRQASSRSVTFSENDKKEDKGQHIEKSTEKQPVKTRMSRMQILDEIASAATEVTDDFDTVGKSR